MLITEHEPTRKLNDVDIRAALKQSLQSTLPTPYRIVDELSIAETRIDVVAITPDSIHGYELKGDNDTLARLCYQIPAYGQICDLMTLVVTPKFEKKVLELDYLPDYWGVTVAHPQGESCALQTIREAATSNRCLAKHLLYLLWAEERKTLLKTMGPGVKVGNCKLNETIESAVTLSEIQQFVRETLINRALWRDENGRSLYGK